MHIILKVNTLAGLRLIKRATKWIELTYLIKPIIRTIVFKKKQRLWGQEVMIVIKRKLQEQYLLEVYSLQSPYFSLSRVCTAEERSLITEDPDEPLFNVSHA